MSVEEIRREILENLLSIPFRVLRDSLYRSIYKAYGKSRLPYINPPRPNIQEALWRMITI